jgi:hypothetical protein
MCPDLSNSTINSHQVETWEYPEPSPNKTFDIQKTFPPRYRAFRYAYRRHTLDIKLLDNNSWVILDNDWPKYHQLKIQRLAERGNRIVQTLSQARTAACELCQDLAEFLSRRYPQVYTIERSRDNALGWYGLGAITRISMSTQGASYDLIKEDPLTVGCSYIAEY